MTRYDAIILGAGAAGLFCAREAARRGRKILVLDHGKKAGRKLRIAGGGKANITNRSVGPENYLSANPHFCRSALAGLSSGDVLAFLAGHRITVEERDHGRLFTNEGADTVVAALENDARTAGARFLLGAELGEVRRAGTFEVAAGGETFMADNVVVALGGPAWAAAGATDAGYGVAARFGVAVSPPRPALAPLVLGGTDTERKPTSLAGVSLEAQAEVGGRVYRDQLLFTHKGLSGPLALQASLRWKKGEPLVLDLLPGRNILDFLTDRDASRLQAKNALARLLPERLAGLLLPDDLAARQLAQLAKAERERISALVHRFTVTPTRTEGLAKAEVTAGGVDTRALSSKTMAAREVPGLFFCGEVMDVTGELGGYNLHWAFASGLAAGRNL